MLKGIHHAGISVLDLERSIDFYCDKLGMQLRWKGAFGSDAMDDITGLRGAEGRSAVLQAGSNQVELFEFSAPEVCARTARREVCEHGISHFCIEVTGLHALYERLGHEGVEFHCAPQVFGKMLAAYLRDPDGNVVELIEVRGSAQR